MNNTMLHYTCGLDLCASHDCIITFIVSSHKIIIEGKYISLHDMTESFAQ